MKKFITLAVCLLLLSACSSSNISTNQKPNKVKFLKQNITYNNNEVIIDFQLINEHEYYGIMYQYVFTTDKHKLTDKKIERNEIKLVGNLVDLSTGDIIHHHDFTSGLEAKIIYDAKKQTFTISPNIDINYNNVNIKTNDNIVLGLDLEENILFIIE